MKTCENPKYFLFFKHEHRECKTSHLPESTLSSNTSISGSPFEVMKISGSTISSVLPELLMGVLVKIPEVPGPGLEHGLSAVPKLSSKTSNASEDRPDCSIVDCDQYVKLQFASLKRTWLRYFTSLLCCRLWDLVVFR